VVPPRPEQGDRYAQYNLAIMLLKGQGTQQDAEEALYWCSAAAEQGSAKAQLQTVTYIKSAEESGGSGAGPRLVRETCTGGQRRSGGEAQCIARCSSRVPKAKACTLSVDLRSPKHAISYQD
jgi:TPR repeat protein